MGPIDFVTWLLTASATNPLPKPLDFTTTPAVQGAVKRKCPLPASKSSMIDCLISKLALGAIESVLAQPLTVTLNKP